MSLKFTVGDLTIHRIIEQEYAFMPALEMLPGLTPELLVENRSWMEPAALDADLRSRLAGTWHERDIEGKLHAVKHMRAETIASLGTENRVDEGGWDLRPLVADYPKPVLILAAAPGESVMSEDDLAFVRSRGGANVAIITYADQGHNLHRTDFDRYIADTKAFLTKT